MTASFPNRNVVIASVQTGCDITPVHIVGNEVPGERENGGDLITGDTFYDTETNVYFVFDGLSWVTIGGPGIIGPLIERIAELEQKLTEPE